MSTMLYCPKCQRSPMVAIACEQCYDGFTDHVCGELPDTCTCWDRGANLPCAICAGQGFLLACAGDCEGFAVAEERGV